MSVTFPYRVTIRELAYAMASAGRKTTTGRWRAITLRFVENGEIVGLWQASPHDLEFFELPYMNANTPASTAEAAVISWLYGEAEPIIEFNEDGAFLNQEAPIVA